MDGLSRLNDRPAAEGRAELLRCCGSSRWAEAVLAHRPFADASSFYAAADSVWWELEPADWREAFAHQPALEPGSLDAPEELLTALAEANRAYEERFGYIFIVWATDKAAEDMLALLLQRLAHAPADEIRVAAGEQAKITRSRLELLLNA